MVLDKPHCRGALCGLGQPDTVTSCTGPFPRATRQPLRAISAGLFRGTHVGTNYGTPWMEKEGMGNVSMEFESGALGYHFGTWGAAGTRLAYSFQAHCTGAMIEADITNGQLKVLRHVRGEAYRDDEAASSL